MDDELYGLEKRRNRGFLGHDSSALSSKDAQDRRQLRYELDLNSWNLRIWGVAASGFLTDSYNLFSTNVILASIIFVYFPDQRYPGIIINIFTLLGSVVGQLLFGYLADKYGRTKLYGIELVLVIVSTIGVATSSFGYNDMSFLAIFTWWRFVMGVGIGAEYPLSAVITSEWSSTRSRATMLSSVFLMQPIGQALAQLVGLWVLLGLTDAKKLQEYQCGLNNTYDEECRKIVDGIWRIVIGSGAVPAVLAIVFRFFLYDCGLYSLEVKNKPGIALRNTQRIYGTSVLPGADISVAHSGASHQPPPPTPIQFTKEDLKNYLFREGNWIYLLGTSITWFILDVGFYGFSLDNRGTLADIWATQTPEKLGPHLSCWHMPQSAVPAWRENGIPRWATDRTKPCHTIYDVLFQQASQYLISVSISSILGSICFIYFANRVSRKRWLTASFITLSTLFVITGGVYYGVAHTPAAPVTVTLVAICHFAFNFGANTLTFIIPAEIFPTCYRSTCHGISAAAGKIGSLVAVLVVYGIDSSYKDNRREGLILILFGSVLLLGAIYPWAYLPEVQRPTRTAGGKTMLETKSLEELGSGYQQARLEGETFTVKEKVSDIRRRRKHQQQQLQQSQRSMEATPEESPYSNEVVREEDSHHHHYHQNHQPNPAPYPHMHHVEPVELMSYQSGGGGGGGGEDPRSFEGALRPVYPPVQPSQ